jgi:DNA helicase-2/ATP-dependent DNA helicase PcrA
LEDATLASDQSDLKKQGEVIPSVSMMTLHASKGLEFPVVFLVGLEEGIFPSQGADESDEELEEERRLCYVGLTRAKNHLYLTSASVRRIWGQLHYQEPSRFLQEIPTQLLSLQELSQGVRSMPYRQETKYYDDLDEPSWVGRQIKHPEYGLGKVIAQEGTGKEAKVSVNFGGKGVKKFLLRFLESLSGDY